MRQIERWKIKEFADSLGQFAIGLKAVQEPEWAQVFTHFEAECRKFLSSDRTDPTEARDMKMLLRNVRSCFTGSATLKEILRRSELSKDSVDISEGLILAKEHLFEILEELELQAVEFVH